MIDAPYNTNKCRPAGNHATLALNPQPTWSIQRATIDEDGGVKRFRSEGIVLADDENIDGDACLDAHDGDQTTAQCVTWLATVENRTVGLIRLRISETSVGRISELCITPDLRNSRLPTEMFGYALRFSRHAGILKVVLGTHLSQKEAWKLFGECGYDVGRHRRKAGRNVMEFYLNLYQQPDCQRQER